MFKIPSLSSFTFQEEKRPDKAIRLLATYTDQMSQSVKISELL
jgi:hypothetical protein